MKDSNKECFYSDNQGINETELDYSQNTARDIKSYLDNDNDDEVQGLVSKIKLSNRFLIDILISSSSTIFGLLFFYLVVFQI